MNFSSKRIYSRLRKATSFLLSLAMTLQLTAGIFLYSVGIDRTEAAIYTFSQTDWSSGASASSRTHTQEQSSPGAFANYSSASSTIKYLTSGELSLSASAGTLIETLDADFNDGDFSSGTATSSGSIILTSSINSGSGADGAFDDTSAEPTSLNGYIDGGVGNCASSFHYCIDTDNAIQQGVYNFTTFTLTKTVRVFGSNPLIIRATGNVAISGTINGSGENGGYQGVGSGAVGGAGGPGGGAGGGSTLAGVSGDTGAVPGNGGGSPPADTYNANHNGGGGGGYRTAGENGSIGFKDPAGTGGGTYGDDAITNLYGGSGGAGVGFMNGSGMGSSQNGAKGGGGGGAISITSAGSVTISGIINVNGGNGGAGNGCTGCAYMGGGAGGGSGGSVKINADSIDLSLSGNRITSTGGAGGTGYQTGTGGTGGVGAIRLEDSDSSISGVGSASPSASVSSLSDVVYASSESYTSSVLDSSAKSFFSTLTYATSTQANTTVTVDIRAGNSATPDGTWTSWQTGIASGGDISVLDGNRYVQYKVNLATSDTSVTPSFNDITINYSQYDTNGDLIASFYDTEAVPAKVSSIAWTESLPTGTDIKFQIRTSVDGATWSDWLGPTSTSDYYTDPSGGETINSAQTDKVDDQWMQYRVFLSTTDTSKTPTLSDVTLSYDDSANASPTAPTSGITGADDPIYAGVQYQITATSTDSDGWADLDRSYLLIENPAGTSIEFYATEQGGTTSGTATTTSGSAYLSGGVATYSYATTTNSIITTWTFTPGWDWTESGLIEYGLKAVDDNSASSGYSTTTLDVLYENDLDYSGTLTATASTQGSISSGDWVQASEIVTFSGLSVVYQGGSVNPADSDFNIQITNDSTGSWTQSSGSSLNLAVTATSSTDISDIHNIDIIGIPTGGSDVSTKTWTLKVDGDSPTNVGLSLPANNATGVATSTTLVALTATDANSGLNANPYYFELATDTAFTQNLQNSGWQSSSSWSPTLASDTTYYFRVKAKDIVSNESVQAGHSADTVGYGKFTTVPSLPTAPSGVSVSRTSDTEFVVSWTDNSSNEDNFIIERNTDTGSGFSGWSAIATTTAGVVSFTDNSTNNSSDPPQTDERYQYRVRAYNATGYSSYGTDSTIRYASPTAPTIASPTTVASSTSITWNWTDNSNFESSFRVDYLVGASSATDKDGIASGATSWEDTDLTPGTGYAVEVHAYRSDSGESTASAQSSTVYTLANVPMSPSVANTSDTELTVSWSANSNSSAVEYYVLNQTKSTNSGWITSTSWKETGLSESTSYSYKIKARNGAGVETAYSSLVSGKTTSTPVVASSGRGAVSPAAIIPPVAPAPTVNNPEGGFSVKINSGNETTIDRVVTLSLFAGSDIKSMAISEDPNFSFAVQEPYKSTRNWTLSNGYGEKTIYVKFYTLYGYSSSAVFDNIKFVEDIVVVKKEEPKQDVAPKDIPDTAPDEDIHIVVKEEPVHFIPKIIEEEKKSNVVKEHPKEDIIIEKRKEVEVAKEHLEEKEVVAIPEVFKNEWDLVQLKKIKDLELAPLLNSIDILVNKFPEIKNTFTEIGVNNLSDLNKLNGLELDIPKVENIKNIAWNNLSPNQIKEIPRDIILIRNENEKIDLNTKLVIDKKGGIKQKIQTVGGESLSLAVKPEDHVDSVVGYVVLKSRDEALNNIYQKFSLKSSIYNAFSKLFNTAKGASDISLEDEFVLSKFEYSDLDGDGIYTTKINTPSISGKYEIITIIDYRDPSLGSREIRLITIIDPEGYVYEGIDGKELRIVNATVSLYWLNKETGKYELWKAENYKQVNPQKTDKTGQYSFLVPEGRYYLEVISEEYEEYQGKEFDVVEGGAIHENLKLSKKYSLAGELDWKVILLIVVTTLLAYSFYNDRVRKVKINNKINKNA